MDVRRHVRQQGLLFALVLTLLATLAGAPDAVAATTMPVRGDTAAGENEPGWLFNRDTSTSTPFEFTTDEARIGQGSVYVEPIGSNPSDKFIAEFFMLTPMGDVESISYDFLIGSGGEDPGDANEFYMNVYANFPESDPDKFYDCRYDVVRTTTDEGWTTVTFDPAESYPVTTRGGDDPSPEPCPGSPADMGDNATLRAIALNLGDSTAGDEGLDGYFDNVVVTVDGETTVYDFEPGPSDKDACKKGGYVDYQFRNQGQCIKFVNTNG